MNELGTYSIGLRMLSKSKDALRAALEVLDVVDELRNLFEPLSADLIIHSRDKARKWPDENLRPPFPTWYIHASPVPETVILEPCFTNPQITQVTELSREVLVKWIENALYQNRHLPETHEPRWRTFFITAVRARIFDEANISDPSTFYVNITVADLRYPLEKKQNEYWVYAPIQYYETQSPLGLQVTNTEGSLHITIPVNWSLWSTPGTAENTALRQALSRIANQGWDLTHIPSVFQI
jgi:hypothetical protein